MKKFKIGKKHFVNDPNILGFDPNEYVIINSSNDEVEIVSIDYNNKNITLQNKEKKHANRTKPK